MIIIILIVLSVLFRLYVNYKVGDETKDYTWLIPLSTLIQLILIIILIIWIIIKN